jgi:hypothetical protein
MSDQRVTDAIEADRQAAAARIRRYAEEYYDPGQREGFEVAAKIAAGWLREPARAASRPADVDQEAGGDE